MKGFIKKSPGVPAVARFSSGGEYDVDLLTLQARSSWGPEHPESVLCGFLHEMRISASTLRLCRGN